MNSLIDVQVSDANKAMAAQHGAQTFDKLIDNTEGENDSYTIGEVYSEDAPAEGVIESAAQLFGLSQAEKIWKVDVTIQAAPYVAGFDELLGLKAGTHEVSGDEAKTVALVWDNGDPATEQQAGWMLEDSAASPVTFTVVRIMSRMRSTPATRATPSTGRPTDCSTMASMIMPDPGTPAVPMEASTAVITMVSCWPIERSMPNTWAMKMAQTPW